MQQLTFLKQGMVKKLNELIGSDLVRDIYLKASQKEAVVPARQSPRNRSRQLTIQELDRIASQTAPITDPELREAFARILARDRANTPGK